MISSRRLLYGCCFADHAHAWMMGQQFGRSCSEMDQRKALHSWWARDVMYRTPMSTEGDTCKCVTHDFACHVRHGADVICMRCGCGCASSTTTGDPCAPVIAHTVLGVVDSFDLPGAPAVGDQYLVWMTAGVFVPAYIATWNGGAWGSTLVGDGQVVQAPGPVLWTAYGGIAGMLYPTITVSYTGFAGQYNVVSNHPVVSLNGGRNIQIQATADGTTWVTVYTGAEADIASGLLINTLLLVPVPVSFRIHYYTSQCDFGNQTATFNNTPPFSMLMFGNSVNAGVNNHVRGGQLSDTQPFPILDTSTSTSSTPLVRRIRRDLGPQNSGRWVAISSGGIIRRSLDEGVTWAAPGGNWESAPLLALLPRANWNLTSLAWATEQSTTVACAGSTWCVFISTDAASTFTYVDVSDIVVPEPSEQFSSIALFNSQEIILGSRTAIWRTTNGGTSWTKVMDSLLDHGETMQVNHLVIMGDVMLAFVQGSTMNGVIRSANRGATWGPLNTACSGFNQDADVHYEPGGQYHLYMGFGEYSSDQGLLFRPIQPGFTSGVTVAALSRDIIAYSNIGGGTYGVYLSMDGGLTNSLFHPWVGSTPIWGLDGTLLPP